jgi:WD40 repeat protein
MRLSLVVFIALSIAGIVQAAEPKPLWELEVGGGNKFTGPGWISYSPDGQSIAAVIVRESGNVPKEYQYHLRVWNASNQKERFNAELGTAKTPHVGDELASFPSDDSILTGGQNLLVRNLENGQITNTQDTGSAANHAVWSVPDLKESFFLRRDPVRFGLSAELFYQSTGKERDEFAGFGRRSRFNQLTTDQTTIEPTRPGLLMDNIALNFGRTHLAASFHDDPKTGKPRHSLVMYEIRTMEEFGLVPIAEAENPHPGAISAIAFARNGKTLATGGTDGSIAIWDADYAGLLWKPRSILTGIANNRVNAITFNRDWSMIAAVTWDAQKPNLLLINADTGKLLKAVRLERELMAVAFSLDGRTLLTGSALGKLRAWDVAMLLKTN